MRWTPRKLQTGHPPKRMKVTFPVGIVQIRVANGTSAVNHHTIADINAAVRNAIHAVAHRAFKNTTSPGSACAAGTFRHKLRSPFAPSLPVLYTPELVNT